MRDVQKRSVSMFTRLVRVAGTVEVQFVVYSMLVSGRGLTIAAAMENAYAQGPRGLGAS